jgi:hypothetical protein
MMPTHLHEDHGSICLAFAMLLHSQDPVRRALSSEAESLVVLRDDPSNSRAAFDKGEEFGDRRRSLRAERNRGREADIA